MRDSLYRVGRSTKNSRVGFSGVRSNSNRLSDFYTAYDSPECPQKKCLLHLIRDMNLELLSNPYDEETRHRCVS